MFSSARMAASHFFHEFNDNEGYRDFKRNHMKNRGRRSESLDFVESRFWKKFSKRNAHDRDKAHFKRNKRNKHYFDDNSDSDDSDDGGKFIDSDSDSDKFFDSDDSDDVFKVQPIVHAPEPASALLFLSGAPVFIYRRYVKKIKKTDTT